MLFLALSHRSSGPAGPVWAPPGWGSCVLSTVFLLNLPAAKCESARAEGRPSSRSGKVHTECMFFLQHLASSLQGPRLIIYLPRKSCIMHVHKHTGVHLPLLKVTVRGGSVLCSLLWWSEGTCLPLDDVSSFLLLPAVIHAWIPPPLPSCICVFLCVVKRALPKAHRGSFLPRAQAKLPAGTGSPSMWGMCVGPTPTHRQEHWHARPNGPGQHTQVSISMQTPVKGSLIPFLHHLSRSAEPWCTETSEMCPLSSPQSLKWLFWAAEGVCCLSDCPQSLNLLFYFFLFT